VGAAWAQSANETAKWRSRFGTGFVILAIVVGFAIAQQTPDPSPPQEFPVTMRQNVVAGTTPVGSTVEAKLTIATLVSGKVIPIGATLSGKVVASEAKTADQPSRLAIRVDSARWKNDSVSITAYLTAWYYPLHIAGGDQPSRPSEGIHGDIVVTVGGSRAATPGQQPYPTTPAPQPRPTIDTNPGPDIPPPTTSTISEYRVMMKDVDEVHLDGGGTAITSSRANLKLDKTTTYVLATGDLAGKK